MKSLIYGAPHGSVQGPVLFTLYTTSLSAIIYSFDIKHHIIADDTQTYTSQFQTLRNLLKSCNIT